MFDFVWFGDFFCMFGYGRTQSVYGLKPQNTWFMLGNFQWNRFVLSHFFRLIHESLCKIQFRAIDKNKSTNGKCSHIERKAYTETKLEKSYWAKPIFNCSTATYYCYSWKMIHSRKRPQTQQIGNIPSSRLKATINHTRKWWKLRQTVCM